MVVQRKWMYLESIFIGGDIRAQLPEEAKKFDDIDKTFKKVCSMLRFCVAREGVCAKELVIGGRRGGGGREQGFLSRRLDTSVSLITSPASNFSPQ